MAGRGKFYLAHRQEKKVKIDNILGSGFYKRLKF